MADQTLANRGSSVGGVSLSDMVIGFFEEREGFSESWTNDGNEVDGENGGIPSNAEERNAFWETQHQQLKGTLYGSSALETRIRNDTKQALGDSQSAGPICFCPKPSLGAVCRHCLMRDVADRLRNIGYNSAVCKSMWRSSPNIPAGEHSYIDVVDATRADKPVVRVVIELDFRSEFQMARGSPEYNKLVEQLPQVYVGKAERLRSLIKILCGAAKECMKENKMHMGPWRKRKYMQAKWFGTCERTTPASSSSSLMALSNPQPKLRASMLTFQMLDKLPSFRPSVVDVV